MRRKRRSTAAPADAEEAPAAVQGKRKRRRRRGAAEEPSEPSESSEPPSEDEAEAEAEDASDIDVDFDFCDPNELDYHGIGELVKGSTWEFADISYPELQDAISGQGNIGTLVKSDAGGENEAVCGLLTVLNLRQFAHQQWPQAVRTSILAKAQKHASADVVESLQSVLGPKHKGEVGLMLSERFANLSPELVPPLHKALQDDIEWSCTTPECPDDERPFYKFTHFLGVARCHAAAPEGAAAASEPAPAPRGKRKRARGQQGSAQLSYLRPEEEAYVRSSMCSFTFPVASPSGERGISGQPPERRVAFVITWSAFKDVLPGIATFLSAQEQSA